MPDLIIKPTNTSGNKLILKAQDDTAVLTTSDSGVAITAPTIANMANCTFPSGKVNNVFRLADTSSGEYQANVDSSASKVPADALSWSATSGRHYLVNSQCPVMPQRTSDSNSGRTQTTRLYVGTTNRSEGDTQASTGTDTILYEALQGRNLASAQSSGAQGGYYICNMQGFFTAGSTATHYVYLTIHTSSSHIQGRMNASSTQPWTVIIYEIMP